MLLKKILCIDDEEDILEVTRLSLETIGGFNVATCMQSSEAIKKIAEFHPDLILLDVMMPGLDGLLTLKMINTNPLSKLTPVIFMTAKIQPKEVEQYKIMGAAGLIKKPFDPMTLPKEVEALWREFHQKHG